MPRYPKQNNESWRSALSKSVMHTEMLTALLRPGDMRVQRDNIAPMHEMCAGRLIISGDAMIYSSTAPSHATFFA